MKQERPFPKLIISKRATRSLKSGHPWVYESEVLHAEAASDGSPLSNGCIVDLFEENGTWHGAAFFSEKSVIRARVITRNANDHMDAAFWERRLRWAWEYRKRVMGADKNACRVVFSEADGIPGLVVDRYENALVAQIGTVGVELIRDELFASLLSVMHDSGEVVAAIYERCDSPVREKEGLPLRAGWWKGGASDLPTQIQMRENGVLYTIDLEQGQKTGFFLDQKYNRLAVAKLSKGLRVMDAFCHVGPFGLNALAGGAEFVNFVDVSEHALKTVAENAKLNAVEPARFATTRADIVSWLPELAREKARLRELGGPFDLIVLDPPAFAKRKSDVRTAAGAYRSINEAALKLLTRGSFLATCSCSQHMTHDLLIQVISEAAHNAGVQIKQIEDRQQAPDHPILVGFPESHYLDFFIFQVV